MRSIIRRCALAIAIIAAVASALAVRAAVGQSLSDLNWEGFQQRTGAAGVETQVHGDPFASGAVSPDELRVEDLQLSGIVFGGPSDAYALISGYLVRPGDLIAGYRVEAIERDRIKLDRVGSKYILILGGGL
jgi:hypothetical protein